MKHAAFLLALVTSLQGSPAPTGTSPLTMEGDLSVQMVAGISKFLDRKTDASIGKRANAWNRNFGSVEAYNLSVKPNRERLRKIIGAVDERLLVEALEYVATTSSPGLVYENKQFRVFAVRWPVLEGVHGEGLLVQPKSKIRAYVVALPDADQTPEQLLGISPGIPVENQTARWLATSGCQVIIPTLISRDMEHSGNDRLGLFTNQPHREWLYRQAFEMGRHIIGYEVQKVLAAVDWFANASNRQNSEKLPIGVTGYNEGALIAFYAAACDSRIDAALVSGYFQAREQLWSEPIYRNLFGLLNEFGDAEIATLITPRKLILEHSAIAEITGPETRKGRRTGSAPGVWKTAANESVNQEWIRSAQLLAKAPETFSRPRLVSQQNGMTTGPGSAAALIAFLTSLGIESNPFGEAPVPLKDMRVRFETGKRQLRQFKEIQQHVQTLLRHASGEREEFLWKKVKTESAAQWDKDIVSFRDSFRHGAIGWFDEKRLPLNARSRKFKETDKWVGHEIVLDVWDDVFAWGYLLIPKDLEPGEKRPVVVCQHGLEGLPADVINEDEKARPWRAYKAFAAKLAERGFVVFAPHNPYRGKDAFRELQRKLNPLGSSLFSVIIPQHTAIIDWLETQPYVDSKRIGFYGLSYGGKSAMRIPALETRYALSICSADFNEWVWKNASIDWRSTYMYTGEYEIYEWDLGHTFNYAEMAALICPRPFMVERGHKDGVGVDEWVAFEYAKIRRLYDYLDIGDQTEIEWFNGPHTINGQATYRFLHRHLNWPEPK
ncbi:MAG: dienelactone hydrolase family protein [Verrucomicrobiia bacterium]